MPLQINKIICRIINTSIQKIYSIIKISFRIIFYIIALVIVLVLIILIINFLYSFVCQSSLLGPYLFICDSEVPNFAEPIEKGSKTAKELMKVVRKYELANTSPTFAISHHRLAMQDLQISIELSKISRKQEISSSISELTELSSACEDIIRQTYGSFRSLQDLMIANGKNIIMMLESTNVLNINFPKLKIVYSQLIDEINAEIISILNETIRSLDCLEKLNGLNKNVYFYISNENKSLELSLYKVQNSWFANFGENKKLILDIQNQLELIANLNKERIGFNKEVTDAKGELKEFQRYIENKRVNLNREKNIMAYLNHQLNAINKSLADMDNSKIKTKASMNEHNEL